MFIPVKTAGAGCLAIPTEGMSSCVGEAVGDAAGGTVVTGAAQDATNTISIINRALR